MLMDLMLLAAVGAEFSPRHGTYFSRSFPRVLIPSSLLGLLASTPFLSELGIPSDPGSHHWHQVCFGEFCMFWKYGLSLRTLEAMLRALRTSRSPAGRGRLKKGAVEATLSPERLRTWILPLPHSGQRTTLS